MQILGFVAHLRQRRQSRPDVKVHVAEIRVLRHMKPDRNRRWIPFPYLEIDIAHCRIEGVGIRVSNRVIRRHASRWRKGNANPRARRLSRCKPGEDHHHTHPCLKARCVRRKIEHRPCRSVAEHANPWPHIHRSRQPIAPGRNEDNSFAAMARRLVDGGLNRGTVIDNAIRLCAEFLCGQIDGFRIFDPRRKYRGRGRCERPCKEAERR